MRKGDIWWALITIVVAALVALLFATLPVFKATVLLGGIMTIIFCVLIATYKMWLWSLLRALAARDFIVTNVMEGTGKMVLQNGEAVRFLTANPKTDPDERTWHLEQEDGEDQKAKDLIVPKGKLLKPQRKLSGFAAWIDGNILPGGMRWVGFKFMGYELLWYNFRWEVLRSSEPKDDEVGLVKKRKLPNDKWVASFAQRINYIYLRDAVYYVEVMGAETKGREQRDDAESVKAAGMPIDLHCVITIRIVNPYLALIFIHDWLESSFGLVRPSLRSWVSHQFYEGVLSKTEAAEREHDELLKQAGTPEGETSPEGKERTVQQYLECAYGVRIKRIAFDDVVPPDGYVTASELRAAAEQNKIRIATEAEAERDKLTIVATGEAKRIKIVVAALRGDRARELRRLEALEKVGENGNMVVLSGEQSQLLLSAPNKGKKGDS